MDLMQESRCHMIGVGAEAGSAEQQEKIKKNIDVGHFEYSLKKMNRRNITTACRGSSGTRPRRPSRCSRPCASPRR